MRENRHGGDIYRFAQENGCRVDEVIDLSSNINFIKPELDIDFNSIDTAPYPDYSALQSDIAALYGVDVSNIELFNGATSAIYALYRLLGLKHTTLYAPLYLEYQKAAKTHGYTIDHIHRFEDLYAEVRPQSLVVFVNPSTPDGSCYLLKKLMEHWSEKECTVLIDESFLDFAVAGSALSHLKSYRRLYVLKSMTKFYAAAGIRIGALISSAENIEEIHRREPLWKLSRFDSLYLQSALRDSTFAQRSQSANESHREYLVRMLEAHPAIEKVFPSCANFVMAKLGQMSASAFQSKLTPYRIMVRDCSNFEFLDERYLRIAVKDMQALLRLKEALCEISI